MKEGETVLRFRKVFVICFQLSCDLSCAAFTFVTRRKLEDFFLLLFPVAHDALVTVRRETASDTC